MTKEQFIEQYSRLTAEWPRAYGESKAEMFAKEFAGHEYMFFARVVDQLLRKFRYPPQVTDVWSAITEVQGEMFKSDRKKNGPRFKQHGGDCLPVKENLRRWNLLVRFISDRDFARRNPDWLRQNIWPNETREESQLKHSEVILEDAAYRSRIQRSL